jgi:hypothetical protein
MEFCASGEAGTLEFLVRGSERRQIVSPHPALCATFSPREKENGSVELFETANTYLTGEGEFCASPEMQNSILHLEKDKKSCRLFSFSRGEKVARSAG